MLWLRCKCDKKQNSSKKPTTSSSATTNPDVKEKKSLDSKNRSNQANQPVPDFFVNGIGWNVDAPVGTRGFAWYLFTEVMSNKITIMSPNSEDGQRCHISHLYWGFTKPPARIDNRLCDPFAGSQLTIFFCFVLY